MFALQRKRNERIRIRGRRQRFVVEAHDPEMIEAEAGGFEQAHDLDGRAGIFDLERGPFGDGAQARQRFVEVHGRRGEIERGEVGERVAPGFDHLILAAR